MKKLDLFNHLDFLNNRNVPKGMGGGGTTQGEGPSHRKLKLNQRIQGDNLNIKEYSMVKNILEIHKKKA